MQVQLLFKKLASPWLRYYGVAVVCGIATALGFEKFGVWSLGLVGLLGYLSLVYVMLHLGASALAKVTYCYFLTFLVAGLHGFAYAMHAEWEKFWWMVPFAVLGLPAFIALFYVPCAWVLRLLKRANAKTQLVAYALAIAVMDYVRAKVFTGLPWLLFGQMGDGSVLKSYALFYQLGGVYLFGAVVLVGMAWTAVALRSLLRPVRIMGLSLLLLFAALPHYSVSLPVLSARSVDQLYKVPIVMVQPDIPQTEKWAPQFRRRNLQHLQALSRSATHGAATPRILVWPEAAVAAITPDNQARALSIITAPLRDQDFLVFGAARLGAEPHVIRRGVCMHNSLFAVRGSGEHLLTYDKVHLVPFGEYVPLREYFGALIDPIVPGAYDYCPGRGALHTHAPVPRALDMMLPLICYEGIFGHEVRGRLRPDHRWMLNITNDGWYLDSSVPFQHLHITKLRAVELGLPIVRVAWRGISVCASPFGEELGRIDFGVSQALPVDLPLIAVDTLYRHYGDLTFFLFCTMIFLMLLMINLRKRT